jgi:general secretion pathway protein A
MYAAYFGLSEPPFSISPDPRYLYMSKRHREAMAHLLYGVQQSGGFLQLTGEVGTGKTTLCRCLLSQLPDNIDVAMLLNPNLDENELLAAICDELKIDYSAHASPKQLLNLLNDYLLRSFAEGRHTVLIFDEAQLLSRPVLEQIRLLTNLETTTEKLLQIILIGQPELAKILRRADLRQLNQRITARYHLQPLSSQETSEYIRYRLEVAGCRNSLFSDNAMHQIYQSSGGVPRLVNVICDRALMGAYSQDKPQVTRSIARHAAVEVLGEEEEKVGVTHWVWLPAVASLAAVLVFTPVGDRALSWFSGLQLVEKLTTAVVDPAPENSVNQIPDAEVKAATPLIAKTDSNQSDLPMTPLPTPPTLAVPVGPPPSTKISDVAAGDLLATAMIDTPSISELLREYAALNGKAEAFSRLTTLWGERLDLFDDDRVCREIERLSLRCFKSRGTWNNLRSHNRAAILVLKPLTDVSHYVVVTQVENGRVSLDFAGEKVEYPISHVDPYWFGDYWLLWRPPPLRSLQLSLDDAGADVLWLRQALNRVASSRGSLSDLNEERPVFDTELLQHVIGFQRRNALNADGVVGVETLMRLNAMLKGDELPLLIRSPTS